MYHYGNFRLIFVLLKGSVNCWSSVLCLQLIHLLVVIMCCIK